MVYQLASVCGVADYALECYIADEAGGKERLAELIKRRTPTTAAVAGG